jgi:hypothetical protein
MLTTIIDMRPVSVSSHHNFLPLINFNCQAVDTFLASPQCNDIKDLALFDREWEVLVDVAHVLLVESRIFSNL